MPDIYDMELDARPDWSEIYNSSCDEHGTQHIRTITVYYTDLIMEKNTNKNVEFCMECVIENPGENQYFNILGDNNEQTQIRSNAG